MHKISDMPLHESWTTNLLKYWETQGVDLDPSSQRKIIRLLHRISIDNRGRIVSQMDSKDERFINKIGDEWIINNINKHLDGYARSIGYESFINLTIHKKSNSNIITHIENALSNLRNNRKSAGFVIRDKLLSEVHFSNSLHTLTGLALDLAITPENLEILIGTKYIKYLSNLISVATTSIWIATASITIPNNKHHFMHPLFLLIDSVLKKGIKITVFLSDDIDFIDGLSESNSDKTFRWFLDKGADVILLDSSVKYHANIVIIDNKVTLIGSHRWSGLGLTSENESSIAITNNIFALDAKNRLIGIAREGLGRAELG